MQHQATTQPEPMTPISEPMRRVTLTVAERAISEAARRLYQRRQAELIARRRILFMRRIMREVG